MKVKFFNHLVHCNFMKQLQELYSSTEIKEHKRIKN